VLRGGVFPTLQRVHSLESRSTTALRNVHRPGRPIARMGRCRPGGRRLNFAPSSGIGEPVGDLGLVQARLSLKQILLLIAGVRMSVVRCQPGLEDPDGLPGEASANLGRRRVQGGLCLVLTVFSRQLPAPLRFLLVSDRKKAGSSKQGHVQIVHILGESEAGQVQGRRSVAVRLDRCLCPLDRHGLVKLLGRNTAGVGSEGRVWVDSVR
jgi:hypothetical protein